MNAEVNEPQLEQVFPDKDTKADKSRRIIVHMIHGTWPDGVFRTLARRIGINLKYPSAEGKKYWFQTSHPFRCELEYQLRANGLTPDIRVFSWPGSNSFAARARAAEEFVPHLLDGIKENVRQIVIGHSHGGSVAMLALKNTAKEGKPNPLIKDGKLRWVSFRRESDNTVVISSGDPKELDIQSMQNGIKQVELITLSTPFLRIERFGSKEYLWKVFGVCWMIIFGILGVWSYRHFKNGLILYLPAFILFMLTKPIVECIEFIQNKIITAQANSFLGKRIQCIRGLSDEAGLGISLGIIVSNLIRTILVYLGKCFGRVSTFICVLAACAGFGALVYALLADKSSPFLQWIYVTGYTTMGIFVLFVVISIMQGVLGIELALVGFSFLTTVESSPDGSNLDIVTLATTKDSAEGLHYSIYSHPGCISEIIKGLGLRLLSH